VKRVRTRFEADDAIDGQGELEILFIVMVEGAWSVAMMSIVPSAWPSMIASTSSGVRSGRIHIGQRL
jgi:hypothetical protein